MFKSVELSLTPEVRATLGSWSRSGTTEQRIAERARTILAAADGVGTNEIARRFGTTPSTVSKWRTRFLRHGLEGLSDAPRTGRPKVYGPDTDQRILELLDQEPPPGHAQWTAPLLSERLGDVSVYKVWRVLAEHGVALQRRHS